MESIQSGKAKVQTIENNNRLGLLQELVDELMKEQPDEGKVALFMKKTGITYTKDPIERINMVLKALHFDEPMRSE